MGGKANLTPVLDRIWRRLAAVDTSDPDACWLWPGALQDGGYGHVGGGRRGQTNLRVTRVLLAERLGRPLTPGHHACHRCDNPPCCNPAHLYEGTRVQNQADSRVRGRAAVGERHGNAKLREDDVRSIRADPAPNAVVARRFGLSPSAVSMIRSRRRWASVL